MYFLAVNYYSEGWKLSEYKTINELIDDLKNGASHGHEFKILIEAELNINDTRTIP